MTEFGLTITRLSSSFFVQFQFEHDGKAYELRTRD